MSLSVAETVCPEKKCVYCNSYVRQNLRVRCSLNFEFGMCDVKCIFIFFNVNMLTQHVNYTCLLFWKCSLAYYWYIQRTRGD